MFDFMRRSIGVASGDFGLWLGQFLKFCGLDLSTQQSGQHRGQTQLSKFGNARLRWRAAIVCQQCSRGRIQCDHWSGREYPAVELVARAPQLHESRV